MRVSVDSAIVCVDWLCCMGWFECMRVHSHTALTSYSIKLPNARAKQRYVH